MTDTGISKSKKLDPPISYFEKITKTTGGHKIPFSEFMDDVLSGRWKDQIQAIRNEGDEGKQKTLKSGLPYVTVSGTFKTRSEKGIDVYSTLIAIDIDNLVGLKGDLDKHGNVRAVDEVDEVQKALASDEHTYAVFKSARGRGLCVVVVGSKKEYHLGHYRWAESYYKKGFGLTIDKACKDLSRPRYGSWDPNAHMNFEPTLAGYESEATPRAVPTPVPAPERATPVGNESKTATAVATGQAPTPIGKPPDWGRIANELATKGGDRWKAYNDWQALAFSLATLGEEGRGCFHTLSQAGEKYDHKETDAKFTNALKTANGDVTIGTFIDLAQKAGVELYNKDEKRAYAIAKSEQEGKASGTPNKSKSKGKEKEKALHPFAILNFILSNFKYTYNSLINDFEFEGKRVNEKVKKRILRKVRAGLCPKVTLRQLEEAIFEEEGQDAEEGKEGEMPYNPTPIEDPVAEYVKTLQDTPRDTGIINRFVDLFPFKDTRAKPFLKKWLLSMYGTYTKGKTPGMLVLVGPSGIGKSHVIEDLMPPELEEYCQNEGLRNRNDAKRMLCQNVLVGADEIQDWTPPQLKAIRDTILQKKCSWREMYEKKVTTTPRRALLAGTASDTSFLQEGDRGFICIELESTKGFREAFDAIDKTTLFYEAWTQGQEVTTCQMNEEELGLLHEINDESQGYIDDEGDLTLKHVKPYDGTIANSTGDKTFITATEIKMVLHEKYRAYNLSTKAIAKILRGSKLNYQSQKHHKKRGFWLELEGLTDIIEKQKERFDISPPPVDTEKEPEPSKGWGDLQSKMDGHGTVLVCNEPVEDETDGLQDNAPVEDNSESPDQVETDQAGNNSEAPDQVEADQAEAEAQERERLQAELDGHGDPPGYREAMDEENAMIKEWQDESNASDDDYYDDQSPSDLDDPG